VKRRPKQIGTEGETAVVTFLKTWFPGCHRAALQGNQDTGDIDGIEDLCVQVKTVHATDLAGWVDQTTKQAARKGVPFFVVVHKRFRRGDAGEWYVTLPLKIFAPLYARLVHPADS
jgi:hypothetical protein